MEGDGDNVAVGIDDSRRSDSTEKAELPSACCDLEQAQVRRLSLQVSEKVSTGVCLFSSP